MHKIALLALFVAAVTASPGPNSRIIGGSATTINNYPSMVATLFGDNQINYIQWCGGSLLNQRSVLTAAHCFDDGNNVPASWRLRVGSSFANSGGTVYNVNQNILHPSYSVWNSVRFDHDIAIMRSATTINYINNAVQPASIAGTNYNLADNQVVWAAGWGWTEHGWYAEQLRHVQVYTINQAICLSRYGSQLLSDNMLCSGVLNVGGRDQCSGDSGGPLYHNGVVVGVCSWGSGCADSYYPGVNVRVSRYTTWIQANA